MVIVSIKGIISLGKGYLRIYNSFKFFYSPNKRSSIDLIISS